MTSSFSQYSNYSLYAAKNGHYVRDDFLLVDRFCYYLHAYLPEFVLSEHWFLVFSRPVWQPAVSGTMSVLFAIVATDVLMLSSS